MAGVDVHVLDADVTLLGYDDTGPVPVRLERVTVRWDEDGPAAVLAELAADPEAWARIDAGALLHLDPGARGPDLGRAPATGAVMRIRAVLDASLTRELGPVEAADVARRMQHGDGEDPLRAAASWWALAVHRPVESPAGVEGELSVGFRTAWNDTPPPEGMASVLALALAEEGVTAGVELDDGGDALVRFRAADCLGLASPRERVEQALVYLVLPRLAPPERYSELARLTALVNYDLPIGCLELQPVTGQVRVRTSVDVAGDRLSLALARNLVGAALHVASHWLPAVHAVMDGAPAEAALASIGSAERA